MLWSDKPNWSVALRVTVTVPGDEPTTVNVLPLRVALAPVSVPPWPILVIVTVCPSGSVVAILLTTCAVPWSIAIGAGFDTLKYGAVLPGAVIWIWTWPTSIPPAASVAKK